MASRQHAQAETLVRQTGARTTRPRVEILAVLLAAERALSHNEVERRVNSAFGIDRVTVYRVLDWLSEQGLAHRIAGEDRVSRYNAVAHTRSRSHAHFQCEGCGTVICLDELDTGPRVRVPRGFVFHDIALTVKGFCASCGHRGRARTARPGRTRVARGSARANPSSRAAHK
jgi:Fur family ferric uptake transcriptional regulator